MAFLLLFLGCKTNKNTAVHRGYHNLTARFNGYYYATESIKEAEDKIRKSYKYDYDKLLPVYLIPTNETAKNTFPEFDKSIKKSTNCIQRHTIKDKSGNEIPTAGKWIDNNWNVIGISHFYKREFFSGIEAFEYVIRTYKSSDKYKSMVWLARSYLEVGSTTQAEPIIGILKDDKKISKYAKKQLPAVRADFLIRRGLYAEAEQELLRAIKLKPSKKDKARYSFIIAQMAEEQNNKKKAIQYYQKVIDAKPEYDIVFHAKMKRARLFDAKNGNLTKLKKELIAMTRDIKNAEYLDEIYYTLGEIYEKEKNETQAIASYNQSVRKSTQNPKQKVLSYLKLGEINFEAAHYVVSGAYYDSTMVTLPKDYKDYENIKRRKETLETIVGYILTIQREDSLQRVASMNEKDRVRFIEKMVEKMQEEEEKKKEEQEAALLNQGNPSVNTPNNGLPSMSDGVKGDWYFYNQTTLSFGVNDFIKKWGNRKLEDDWRRSQKSLSFDENSQNNEDNGPVTKTKKPKNKDGSIDIEPYLIDLPLNDSLLRISNTKIIDAYYNLASAYKDDLSNNKKSINTFDELNKRFDKHKYRASTYYKLHLIYTSVKNKTKADEYKEKLLSEFPNSEYAQLIKNPNYAVEKKSQKGEVELFYTDTYEEYSANKYTSAYSRCVESESRFGKNDFSARFAYIKALCIGKQKGIDSLEMALKKVQALYPKDVITPQVQNMLEIIYNLKHPSEATGGTQQVYTDTFTLNLNSKHFVVIVFPDDSKLTEAFKNALVDFNNNFYGNDDLVFTDNLFGSTNQIINLKSFKNAEIALKYISNLENDATVFSGKIKKELFTIMAIAEDNFQKFAKKKRIDYYKPFYTDHYKLTK